jgi:hypothetical protein
MTDKRRRRSGLPVMDWRAVPEFRVNRLAAFGWVTLQGYQPLTAMSDRLQMTCKGGLNAAISIYGVKVIDRKPRSRPHREEGTV